MRPRKIETLKDLKDFIVQCEQDGMGPQDNILIYDKDGEDYGDLINPTFICHGFDGPNTRPFVVIKLWTDEDLIDNAEHNDKLGTPPHFVS